MESPFTIRAAALEDIETLVGFTLREARDTEGEEPDPQAVLRGVRAAFDNGPPSTYWVAESESGQVLFNSMISIW